MFPSILACLVIDFRKYWHYPGLRMVSVDGIRNDRSPTNDLIFSTTKHFIPINTSKSYSSTLMKANIHQGYPIIWQAMQYFTHGWISNTLIYILPTQEMRFFNQVYCNKYNRYRQNSPNIEQMHGNWIMSLQTIKGKKS